MVKFDVSEVLQPENLITSIFECHLDCLNCPSYHRILRVLDKSCRRNLKCKILEIARRTRMSVRAADDQLFHAQVDSLLVQALDDFALVAQSTHAVVE